jgi:lauroyl/myristoyl acyltransferase
MDKYLHFEKARKGTKKKDNEEEETVWDSEGQKERVLSAVLHSLELDLPRLWKLDVPEEEFVNLYSKVCLIYEIIK